jgi:hypothetical protein
MKKLLTIAALALSTVSFAQVKEGSITYSMKIEGLPDDQAAMMGDMQTTVYFKKDKALSEMKSNMYNVKTLMDKNGMLMLMDQMGQKNYIQVSKADMEKQQKDIQAPKIEYKDDKKTSAGYECKKAVITAKVNDKEVQSEIWYTEKIATDAINNSQSGAIFKGLKGTPLEYTIDQGPAKVDLVATNVSTSPVPDSKFTVSTDGYNKLDLDAMKKQGGGQD